MNVTVSWDNPEKTIIRYDFEPTWTWPEFYQAVANAFAMTRSVGHTVDSISNFKPNAALPPNALFQFRRAMIGAPKNRGLTVIVGTSPYIRKMVGMFSQFNHSLGKRLVLADSLEDARSLLTGHYS